MSDSPPPAPPAPPRDEQAIDAREGCGPATAPTPPATPSTKRKRAPRRIASAAAAADVNRLKAWIEPIACSLIWRDDLADLFLPRRPYPEADLIPPALTGPSTRKACHRALAQSRHYPPGGHGSGMQRCLACGHWAPPNQGEGASGICIDCYYVNLPPERWAWLPSSHPMGWKVKLSHVRAFLADGTLRRLRSKMAKQDAGSMFFCDRDRALEVLREAEGRSRSRRRPLYVVADPRVCGGQIDDDGVMTDTWLGRIELKAIPYKPQGAEGAASAEGAEEVAGAN